MILCQLYVNFLLGHTFYIYWFTDLQLQNPSGSAEEKIKIKLTKISSDGGFFWKKKLKGPAKNNCPFFPVIFSRNVQLTNKKRLSHKIAKVDWNMMD